MPAPFFMTAGLTVWRSSDVKSGAHSHTTPIQLIGVAPTCTRRRLAVDEDQH
jgi:hypothetical protein